MLQPLNVAPCPKCRDAAEVVLLREGRGKYQLFGMVCLICKTTGAFTTKPTKARELWNLKINSAR